MTDDKNPWAVNRQNAVDYLALQIYRREFYAKRGGRTPDEADETVTLPLDIARLVLAAAQAGVHKGRGKGGVRLTHPARNRRDGIILWAKARKAELMKKNKGMPASTAEEKAAEEAHAFAWERYRIALAESTIIRGMGSRT